MVIGTKQARDPLHRLLRLSIPHDDHELISRHLADVSRVVDELSLYKQLQSADFDAYLQYLVKKVETVLAGDDDKTCILYWGRGQSSGGPAQG